MEATCLEQQNKSKSKRTEKKNKENREMSFSDPVELIAPFNWGAQKSNRIWCGSNVLRATMATINRGP